MLCKISVVLEELPLIVKRRVSGNFASIQCLLNLNDNAIIGMAPPWISARASTVNFTATASPICSHRLQDGAIKVGAKLLHGYFFPFSESSCVNNIEVKGETSSIRQKC